MVASQHWKTIAFLYSNITSAIVSWLPKFNAWSVDTATDVPMYQLLSFFVLSHLLRTNFELIAVIEGSVFSQVTRLILNKMRSCLQTSLNQSLKNNFSFSIWKFCIKNVWNCSAVHSLKRAYNQWLLAFHVLLLINSDASAQEAWMRHMEKLLPQQQGPLSWYPKEWRADMFGIGLTTGVARTGLHNALNYIMKPSYGFCQDLIS